MTAMIPEWPSRVVMPVSTGKPRSIKGIVQVRVLQPKRRSLQNEKGDRVAPKESRLTPQPEREWTVWLLVGFTQAVPPHLMRSALLRGWSIICGGNPTFSDT